MSTTTTSPPSANYDTALRPKDKLKRFGTLQLAGRGTRCSANVQDSGYVDVELTHDNNLSHVLSAALDTQVQEDNALAKRKSALPSAFDNFKNIPTLNIVIQIVGSRGDVQPFIALGRALQAEPYGHRIRFCTHPAFKDFVEENGLEFYSMGGDPEQLMQYMVKNPGIIPGKESMTNGDIPKRRKGVAESLEAAWRSCIEPSEEKEDPNRLGFGGHHGHSFIADAIIANPVSFAHIHCAEKLSIPLHLMFTMPWSPTQSFPHPLAQIKATNVDKPVANFLSYSLMELMTWQGLGDVINNFRIRTLQLEPISALWAGGLISRLQVPYTYAWSTALIPKPPDWGDHIGVSGFYFLDLGSKYKPPQSLVDFLEAGDMPIYIGFGSIVIDDPDKTTELIFEAVRRSGVRCLLSKGWSKLGGNNPPENVYLLDNCPHDYLFTKVKAVVHHGGAGTCAIGVRLAKPTVVVPFFGDQAFWGAMIYRAGAGPEPVPFHDMTADTLTESIKFALKDETQERAKEMARQIEKEEGAEEGARQFQAALPLEDMRCMVAPHKLAVWHVKHTRLRLSALAASVLVSNGSLDREHLQSIKFKEWNLAEGPRGPLQGGIASVVGTLTDIMLGVGHLSHQIVKTSAAELSHPQIHHIHRPPKEPEILRPSGDYGHEPHHHHHHRSLHQHRPDDMNKDRTSADQLRTNVTGHSPVDSKVDFESPSRRNTEESADKGAKAKARDGTSDNINPAQHQPNIESNTPEKAGLKRWQRSKTHQALHLYSRRNVASAFPGFMSRGGGLNTSIFQERRKRAKLNRALSDEKSPSTANADRSLHKELEEILFTSGHLAVILMTWPIDLTYNLAAGFHNAPILFCGDDTVRKNVKITGFKTGMWAMGREVTLGFWDATTGLVTQPYRGAKKDGAVGLVKGVGKGFGGLFFKTGAAVFAIPGYSLKGLEMQLGRWRGADTHRYVRNVRLLMGMKEYEASSEEERQRIIEAYEALPEKVRKPKRSFIP